MNTHKLIDGKASAARVLIQVREDVVRLREQAIEPALAVILVGSDPASQVYVRNKILRAEEVGIRSLEHRLPADTSTEQLLILIARLNADRSIHGILLQLPLPAHIDELRALEAIAPDKDVDGFHSQNVGGLSQGRTVLAPCTPSGCLYLLEQTCGDLRGKHAVVIGRSNIVGKPMAALLLQADCSVTVLHSRSPDPPGAVPAGRHRHRCGGSPAVDRRQLAQAWRRGDRRWHQPYRRRWPQPSGGRRRLRQRPGARRGDHPGTRWCRPDDHCLPDEKNTVTAALAQHRALRSQSEALCHSIY
nr:hypothetical protein GCM10020185_85920 [Pseudomonas brassicacearum subsp. brassicacearum]